jgi:uncharacterized membrane protein
MTSTTVSSITTLSSINTSSLNRSLDLAAAIGAGIAGGVFFGFSTFVMKGLGSTPAPTGIAAMQSINRAAPSPLFMTVLFGTAAVGILTAVSALRHLDEPAAVWQLVGAGIYLAGIAVTVAYHVPHNDALAELAPKGADAAAEWSRYLSGWTAWNHVRTLTSIAAAGAFTVAYRLA